MATAINKGVSARDNDFTTVEDLGTSISRIAAVLRAAIATGAGEEEDMAWLVGIAFEEAQAAKAAYDEWGTPEVAEVRHG